MGKRLVIVESPTKAKTITKFLGKDYVVRASYGHVRDLPNNAAEIPANIKSEKWTRLGVNVDKDFEALYIVPPKKKENVQELKTLLKDAEELFLATDEDREGESISWHLLEVLKPKIPVKRLVFHEITKEAIAEAIRTPRSVDESLVRAQETRRIIDRLYGYLISPLLWKKMAPKLSAGRVQSVAMKLLVDRERERIAFRSAKYWDLKAELQKRGVTDESSKFEAMLIEVGGKRVAQGKDFDPATGKLKADSEVVLLDAKTSEELRARVEKAIPQVTDVEEKPYTTKPYAPFTTSTLQQEASRKLRFPVKRTMQIAQTLYENGFITYMRTDSTTLSDEGLNGARKSVEAQFGKDFLYPEPRLYKTKVKNAQEAHEAIRPAGADFTLPSEVRAKLGAEAAKLYELIWQRTLACQMKDAYGTRVIVSIQIADGLFRASGKTLEFAGYLRAYVEDADEPDAEIPTEEKVLPKLSKDEELALASLGVLEHETQPPARYTEGSLIKELERRGIGRPSTWATIVDIVLSRNFAFKKGTALVPTFVATAVTQLMERYFTYLLDYEFTARLEDDLDAISRGEAESLKYLNSFYFGNGHPGLKELVATGEEKIDPREVCGVPLGTDAEGRGIEVRIGRWGPFISDGTNRASLPDGVAPDELSVEKATEILATAAKGPASLGIEPVSGKQIYLKNGRFGPYLQLGENVEGEDRPKMASLLPGMKPEQATFEIAVEILKLPKTLGQHPESKQDVIAASGRFGPYIKCGTDTRSIPAELTPIAITFEQALELLKQPKTRGRGSKPATMRELGKHPVTEKPLVIKSGRYGPYVSDGEINASLPRNSNPDELTMDAAVDLLAARAAKIAEDGPSPKGKRGKGKGQKKTAKAEVSEEGSEEASAPKAKKKAPKKGAAKKAKSAKSDSETASA